MTVKPTISLTDEGHRFAISLVESGRFATLSAVLQHGLRLLQWEEEAHQARLAAIGADLERRSAEPAISFGAMGQRLAEYRAARDAGSDVAPLPARNEGLDLARAERDEDGTLA